MTRNISTTLEHTVDGYGGVTILGDALPDTKEEFLSQIKHSLDSWKIDGRRGVWLKIPASKLEYAVSAME